MRRKSTKTAKRETRSKTRVGLPDLDRAKAAVLGSLGLPESKRGYQHAIEEFIDWYCFEPRLSFNKTVVTGYRIHLQNRRLAPGTINVRLAAVRRLAYEAADTGLLSPELAELTLDQLQRREDHWAIVDLVGKGGHIRFRFRTGSSEPSTVGLLLPEL